MSDGIEYRVGIRDANGSYREIIIITDTIQNAMSIGRAKAKWNEEVASINSSSTEVHIDYSACKGDKS